MLLTKVTKRLYMGPMGAHGIASVPVSPVGPMPCSVPTSSRKPHYDPHNVCNDLTISTNPQYTYMRAIQIAIELSQLVCTMAKAQNCHSTMPSTARSNQMSRETMSYRGIRLSTLHNLSPEMKSHKAYATQWQIDPNKYVTNA